MSVHEGTSRTAPEGLMFRILGPLEVVAAGRVVPIAQPRLRALLTLFALRPNEVLAADWLVEELWSELSPRKGNHALHVAVSRLRRTFAQASAARAEILRTRSPGYVLETDADAIDAFRFERLIRDGRSALETGAAHIAASLFREGLGLWHGPALADAPASPFAQSERARLEEQRIAALEDRIEAELALRRHLDLVDELETLVSSHPFRERLWHQLMTALHGAGRQSESLQAYRRAREVLGEELGVDPGPALQGLHRRILGQDPSLDIPNLAARGHRPSNLTAPITTFVGRERERVEVHRLLERNRLTTLTGVGGVGKTRLAIEVARSERSLPDGTWLADLAGLSDPDLAPATVLSAIGGPERAGRSPMESLTAYLRPRQLLLVLDNCEHLKQACGRLAEDLLEGCPGLSILATSREALGVPGEATYRVSPLQVPEPDDAVEACLGNDAVRLFADRAGFEADSSSARRNALAVAGLCRRLGGLPLALELVASWVETLSVDEIASALSDRFWTLTEGSPDRPARHRSLHAAMDWSYRLLSPDEQKLLRRLSVFRGAFTLEAAEHVGGTATIRPEDLLLLLRALVTTSWLIADADPGGPTWYRLLEPVREYASDQAAGDGDMETVRARHAEFFASLAERAEPEMLRPQQAEWAERLERTHDNFRAALGWALEHDPETGVRTAAALWWFWLRRNHFDEGRRWLERVLERDRSSAHRGRALIGAALLALRGTDYESIERWAAEAVEVTRRRGDRSGQARALGVLWLARNSLSGGGEPQETLEESLRLGREVGDAWGTSVALEWQAVAARQEGDLEAARTALEEALAIQRRMENPRGVVYMAALLAGVLRELKDLDGAARVGGEALSIARFLRDDVAMADALLQLAATEARRGAFLKAARLLGATDALREPGGIEYLPWDRAAHGEVTAQALERLGEEGFARAWDEGRTRALDPAQPADVR